MPAQSSVTQDEQGCVAHRDILVLNTPEIQTDIQGWARLDPQRPDKTMECRNESERSAAHRGNQCYQTHQCDLTTDNARVYNQQNALMTLQKCNMTMEFEIDILIYKLCHNLGQGGSTWHLFHQIRISRCRGWIQTAILGVKEAHDITTSLNFRLASLSFWQQC